MRANPYGAAPAENPKNIRQAMNRVDPRERGLIGAAWYAGYLARAAAAGVDAVTLAATQRAVGHRLREAAARAAVVRRGAARRSIRTITSSPAHTALAGATCSPTRAPTRGRSRRWPSAAEAGRRLRLANLTGAEQTVRLSGAPGKRPGADPRRDDVRGGLPRSGLAQECARVAVGETLTLKPYAIAEIRYG